MLIDCDRCELRDIACSDCAVTALQGMPSPRFQLGDEELRALRVLADAKMIPPLRLRVAAPLQRAS
jgi:hypothetical protein